MKVFYWFTLFMLIVAPLYASIDFKMDFNQPPEEIESYRFKGTKDNNLDGKTDEMYYKDGNKELLIEDTDYDGKMDAVTYYENEVLIKKEVDMDQDGEWDYRYWYKEGELDRTEEAPKEE